MARHKKRPDLAIAAVAIGVEETVDNRQQLATMADDSEQLATMVDDGMDTRHAGDTRRNIEVMRLQLAGEIGPLPADQGLPCEICIDIERDARASRSRADSARRRCKSASRHPKCARCGILFGGCHLGEPKDGGPLCKSCYALENKIKRK